MDTAIVLVSQMTSYPSDYSVHGVFPSIRSAVLHIAKDGNLNTKQVNNLINQFELKHNPLKSFALNGEWWAIIHTPVRDENGL